MVEVTDDLLARAFSSLSDELIEEWENKAKAKPKHKFSKDFESKMEALILREKKSKSYKKLKYIGKIAAAIVIILGYVLFGDTMVVKAQYKLMFEKIETVLDESVMYHFEEIPNKLDIVPYELTYIPEGYKLLKQMNTSKTMKVEYINEQGDYIYWDQYLAIDSRIFILNTECEEIRTEEYKGENLTVYSYDDGMITLYYESGNKIFKFSANNLSLKEIYKMLDSMEQIEKK